ncbi:MAG: 16S rRNA (cytidine(1402)-2'-O)-methyltransferase [Bacillota bacterium]
MTGTLYLCATPIGNLEDVTRRVGRILAEADLICAEDTRQSAKLLDYLGIGRRRLIGYHQHNEATRTPRVIEELLAGKTVAVISDAGTPGISDPGEALVRAAIDQGIPVVPVPGPSAVVAALCASGLPTTRFTFCGFLPRHGKDRRALLQELAHRPDTLIFYEAPHRLVESLRDLLTELGDRRAVIAREISKVYEEFRRGTISQLMESLVEGAPLGEIVLLVAGAPPGSGQERAEMGFDPTELMEALLEQGLGRRVAALIVARFSGMGRNEAYQLGLDKGKD